VLLGPIISRLFTCSNEEKNNKIKKQRVLALVLSLCVQQTRFCSICPSWNLKLAFCIDSPSIWNFIFTLYSGPCPIKTFFCVVYASIDIKYAIIGVMGANMDKTYTNTIRKDLFPEKNLVYYWSIFFKIYKH